MGISSVYDGNVTSGEWHRVAVAMDLASQPPVLAKFIDGIKVGNQTSGLSAVDGRFSLDPSALLFADQDGDTGETYVNSIQFSNGRRPDAFIAALGGPSASKIPGAITATVQGWQREDSLDRRRASPRRGFCDRPVEHCRRGNQSIHGADCRRKEYYRPQIP